MIKWPPKDRAVVTMYERKEAGSLVAEVELGS